uniref:Cyclin N-terminal domain-containing protein n=1 Tax=Panagrolaimus sp. JU765 TaxID=591449 RepID=A0AC34QWL5_9BILA
MPPRTASHKILQQRMRRTMNYGHMRMDNLTLPLSVMVVDYFDRHNPYDCLDIDFASKIASECCINPTTLIVAMVYVDRLRRANMKYFTETASEDVYLSALVVAAKFLQDGGLEEYIWNDEWANCSSKTVQRVNELELELVNELELELLTNIGWDLHISDFEFKSVVESVEQWIALYSMKTHNFFTYNDLAVLVKQWDQYWQQIKVFCAFTGAISATYVGALYFAIIFSGFAHVQDVGTNLVMPSDGLNFTSPTFDDNTSCNVKTDYPVEIELIDVPKTNSCLSEEQFDQVLSEMRQRKRFGFEQRITKPFDGGYRGITC